MSKIINLSISGMHCSACALVIQKSLEKINGVESIVVNFASGTASLKAADIVSEKKIIDVIKKTGYEARIKKNTSEKDYLDITKKEANKKFNLFLESLILSVPLLLFMVYDFFPTIPYRNAILPLSGILSLILATPVQFYFGKIFYKGAYSALRVKVFTMDSLIAIGTTTAYVYSLFEYIRYFIKTGSLIGLYGQKIPHLYFETSAFLITFVLFGKWLESLAKLQTSKSINKLVSMQPLIARVKRDNKTLDIDVSELKKGDICIVRAGEKIPTDGILVSDYAYIDESIISGESFPVQKNKGDKIIGGSINGTVAFEFMVTKLGNDTILARIIKLVEEAQNSRAPIQSYADRISSWFVPLVIFIAILTFVIWFIFLKSSFLFALLSFISVIVISCPCALGLATPAALIAGIGKAAENGILIKGGEVLEKMSRINLVIIDKTGTLTFGKPKVETLKIIKSQKSNSININQILNIIGSIEMRSEHPLSYAIVNEVKKIGLKCDAKVTNVKTIPGEGIQGKLGKETWFIGTKKLFGLVKNLNGNSKEKTTVYFGQKNNVLGYFLISDNLRETSLEAIRAFMKRKIRVILCTGDNKEVTDKIAKDLGIKEYYTDMSPEDKLNKLIKFQTAGYRVAMVGDGINDAPALAKADVGIVMGSGSDVSLETGGVVLLRNNLFHVIKAIDIARQTIQKIKQNLFFALFYNSLGIPIASRMFISFGLSLKPELAGLAMALSSISVVVNSLLLKLYKPLRINYFSMFAPIIMVIIFLFMFVQFSFATSRMNTAELPELLYSSYFKNLVKENKVKVLHTSKGESKFFYYSDKLEREMIELGLTGERLRPLLIKNDIYYPIVLGFKEAEMMRAEHMFNKEGDIIKNFFNKKVIVQKVLPQTDTYIDYLHIVNKNF
ncbi:MAG: heavy metal translocating P-type ATPase [Candidatus Woesearchaeota archaeon]